MIAIRISIQIWFFHLSRTNHPDSQLSSIICCRGSHNTRNVHVGLSHYYLIFCLPCWPKRPENCKLPTLKRKLSWYSKEANIVGFKTSYLSYFAIQTWIYVEIWKDYSSIGLYYQMSKYDLRNCISDPRVTFWAEIFFLFTISAKRFTVSMLAFSRSLEKSPCTERKSKMKLLLRDIWVPLQLNI